MLHSWTNSVFIKKTPNNKDQTKLSSSFQTLPVIHSTKCCLNPFLSAVKYNGQSYTTCLDTNYASRSWALPDVSRLHLVLVLSKSKAFKRFCWQILQGKICKRQFGGCLVLSSIQMFWVDPVLIYSLLEGATFTNISQGGKFWSFPLYRRTV